jgi:hypothetical protein
VLSIVRDAASSGSAKRVSSPSKIVHAHDYEDEDADADEDVASGSPSASRPGGMPLGRPDQRVDVAPEGRLVAGRRVTGIDADRAGMRYAAPR